MLATAKRHGKIGLIAFFTGQARNYRINHIIRAAAIVGKLILIFVPSHATHKLRVIALNLLKWLHNDDVLLVIGKGNIDVIAASIIEGQGSDISLHISTGIFFEKEWIGEIFHHLKINLVTIRGCSLSIIKD